MIYFKAEFLETLPFAVNTLSNYRARNFKSEPTLNDSICWEKAQKLQENLYSVGDNVFAFTNKKFHEQGLTEISKEIYIKHLNRFEVKTFDEFQKSKTLYLYNERTQKCECRDF